MTILADVQYELRFQWPVDWRLLVMFFLIVTGITAWTILRENIAFKGRLVLLALRVVAVSMLFAMATGFGFAKFESILPHLYLLVDQSQSMNLPAGDSQATTRIEAVRELFQNQPAWLDTLRERYQVHVCVANERLTPMPQLESSDVWQANEDMSVLGESLLAVLANSAGQSTAAVVLFSDGAANGQVSLPEAARAFRGRQIPLWSVGVGSEDRLADFAIGDLTFDDYGFVGDMIRVRAEVRSFGEVAGVSPTIQLIDRDTKDVLGEQRVVAKEGVSAETVEFFVNADRAGVWNLELSVTAPIEEWDRSNNLRNINTYIHDQPLSVLLVSRLPSYEFRFLKHLMERSTGQGIGRLVELMSVLQEGDPRYAEQDRAARVLPPLRLEEMEAIDVVVLCDVDAKQLGEAWLNQLKSLIDTQGLGLVYIAGPTGRGASESKILADLLPCSLEPANAFQDVTAESPSLRLTALGKAQDILRMQSGYRWDELPPLQWISRAEQLKPAAEVILEVPKSPGGKDANPIVVSQLFGAGRVWAQLTDESFRWRVQDSVYETYWLQVIRSLAIRKLRAMTSQPKIEVGGSRFYEGEEVEIRYFPGGSGSDQATASLTLTSSSGENRQLELSKDTDGSYVYFIDDLSPGDYLAEGVEGVPEKPIPAVFEVVAKNEELSRTAAAIRELERASEITTGKVVDPANAKRRLVRELPTGERVQLRELPSEPLWNRWYFVLILVGLLTTDWILRKRLGLP